jgi:D-lactate dehydrogenase
VGKVEVGRRHVGDPAPAGVIDSLKRLLGADARITASAVDRCARAADASHILLTPELVVTPRTPDAVGKLMRASRDAGLRLTFRSGGTSLSGQSVTEGVLVDVRREFRSIEVLDDGERVRVQGGATLRQVNQRLAQFGRKLGPDPASEIACTIGGIVANNSSGMACGTRDNAYRTLDSLVLVLASGTTIDTGTADADDRLRALEPGLYEGLLRLRDRVRGNAESVRIVHDQFSMKNTMGYGLNSFLDHTLPVDILTRIVVGSEGTLAFVAEATFRTVPLLGHALTGLLMFRDLSSATDSLPALLETDPTTVELLDATSLRVARSDPASAALLPGPDAKIDAPAALLVEYQAATRDALADREQLIRAAHSGLPTIGPRTLDADAAHRAGLWRIRKGLYATVSAARPSGSTALLEDVVVPVGQLLATCTSLTQLFGDHGYVDSVLFGHAKDGNVHFMLTDRFDRPDRLDAYRDFTEDLANLVLAAGGSLKAEHGTGRTMAPFVRRQFGDELYDVMRGLKTLLDPAGILNPGVIIDADPLAHLRHLKVTPTVQPEVDRCVECGYCEPVCPSKDLTTTPRQRIVLERAIASVRATGDVGLADELERAARYDVVDTCAVDGMCATACPVLINTGELVKRKRRERHGPAAQLLSRSAARHWGGATSLAAAALDLAAALPPSIPTAATRTARWVGPTDVLPLWTQDLPRGGHPRPRPDTRSGSPILLFAACVGRVFDASPGASRSFLALCKRAGVAVVVPPTLAGLCCGTPWLSKGLDGGHAVIRERMEAKGRTWRSHGVQTVVCDASSCTEGLRGLLSHVGQRGAGAGPLEVVDAVGFTLTRLLPRLTIKRRVGSVVVHPTCSSVRAGHEDDLVDLAGTFADQVVVPQDWGCCGFAGDRGLLHPELTGAATAAEAAEIVTTRYDAYLSDNRTCEIGLRQATGRPYRHVLEVLEECTR